MKKGPNSEGSGPTLEHGVATFQVTDTLRGPAVESLNIPYCYARPIEAITSRFLWPSLEHTKTGDLFLCALIPDGFDPTVNSLPGTKAVAMSVQPIKKQE